MIIGHGIKDGKLYITEDKSEINWMDVIRPTNEEVQKILEEYKLPKDYLYDVMDVYEVSRVEGLDDERPNLFVLSYPIRHSESVYTTRVVSIIVVEDVVITIRHEDSEVFENIKLNGFSKIIDNGEIDNFVLELGWRISKGYIKAISELNKQIDDIDKTIRKSSKSESLYQMIDIQKSLINFEIAIKENNPVIKSMFELEYISRSDAKNELLHDLLVENKQAQIMIEKSNLIIDNLSDLFTNLINYKLNVIMKIMTSISIVMTIPTIIGGLWGMNVAVPLAKNPLAFYYIIILSIVLCLIVLKILKDKDFL